MIDLDGAFLMWHFHVVASHDSLDSRPLHNDRLNLRIGRWWPQNVVFRVASTLPKVNDSLWPFAVPRLVRSTNTDTIYHPVETFAIYHRLLADRLHTHHLLVLVSEHFPYTMEKENGNFSFVFVDSCGNDRSLMVHILATLCHHESENGDHDNDADHSCNEYEQPCIIKSSARQFDEFDARRFTSTRHRGTNECSETRLRIVLSQCNNCCTWHQKRWQRRRRHRHNTVGWWTQFHTLDTAHSPRNFVALN